MTWYAHASIHDHKTNVVYSRGDEITNTDIDGWEELVEFGTVSETPYDPSTDEVGPPTILEVDGVRYVQAADNSGLEEA